MLQGPQLPPAPDADGKGYAPNVLYTLGYVAPAAAGIFDGEGEAAAAETLAARVTRRLPKPSGLKLPAPKTVARALDASAAEDSANVVTHLHHSDPMFLGGEPKQALTRLTQEEHQGLHSDLNDFLRNETDDFGNHMSPQRGNSGADIRANFTRDERLGALSRFYSGPGSGYGDAAFDFFAMHPEVP